MALTSDSFTFPSISSWGEKMEKKIDLKTQADKMYDNLMVIDTFLDGLEIACSSDSLKENVYKVKQKSFEIRGFLLRLM